MMLNINLLTTYWRQQRRQYLQKILAISMAVIVIFILGGLYIYHNFQSQQQLQQQVAALQHKITQVAAVPVAQPPPITTEPATTSLADGYVSLQQTHMDIRDILQHIAASGSMNVLLHESVQGTLTINFKQLPWQDALRVVVELANLVVEQQDTILLVRSAQDETGRLQNELQQQQNSDQLAPLTSLLLPIHYAKAAQLATLLQTNEQEWLSPRGAVSVDERTNTLLIRDIPTHLQHIQTMLTALDVPVRQVAIEARIMNVQEILSKELGILWEVTGDVSMGNTALTTLSNDILLNLELHAQENENLVEELAHPRLITADQQTAVIRQGEEIPYQQSAENGGSTVSFKPALLELQVTPHITPDDHIILKLVVKNDTRGAQALADNVPVITTKEIRTQVLVSNGQTIALGGIYTQGKNQQEERVPFISHIPGIGRFFIKKSDQNERKQLLVLVTPKIIVE